MFHWLGSGCSMRPGLRLVCCSLFSSPKVLSETSVLCYSVGVQNCEDSQMEVTSANEKDLCLAVGNIGNS